MKRPLRFLPSLVAPCHFCRWCATTAVATPTAATLRELTTAVETSLDRAARFNGSRPTRRQELQHSITRGLEVAVSAAELQAAWVAAQRHYYLSRVGQETYVVPCDWELVLRSVVGRLPLEGVTEAQLLERLRPLCAHLSGSLDDAVSTESFGAFIRDSFPHLLLVTRSAVSGRPLYHARGRNTVQPTWGDGGEVVQAVQRALDTLGRGKQQPLWTEVPVLEPLLPPELRPQGENSWAALLQRPDMQAHFAVEGTVMVRLSARGPSRRRLVVLDSTSLPTEVDRERLLSQLALPPGGASIKVLRRASSRSSSSAVPGALGDDVESVLVDDLLEPRHVLGALVSSAAAAFVAPMAAAAAHGPKAAHHRRRGPVEDEEEDTTAEGEREVAEMGEETAPHDAPAADVVVLCGAGAEAELVGALQELRPPAMWIRVITDKNHVTDLKD